MQRMTLKASTTAIEEGTFVAVVSAWSPDRERDVIERTAFDRTIEAWQRSGKQLPLRFEHTTTVIGAIDPFSMHSTDEGLIATGEVDRSTDEGRQVWKMIKSGTAGFSIGYISEDRPRKGGGRTLVEIDLLEITATSVPMHPATRALSWKSAGHADVPDLGLGGILGLDPRALDAKSLDPADRLITIAGPDGEAQIVRAGDPFWWEEQEAKELAELERKSLPVEIASFEC
jgi:HK97 family phage prohead protease